MECPICTEFTGSEPSVAAHLCGRHDEQHQAYVGLRDDGSPLPRREHESNDSNEPKAVPTADNARDESEAGDTVAGLVAGGIIGYVAQELHNDDDRDTI